MLYNSQKKKIAFTMEANLSVTNNMKMNVHIVLFEVVFNWIFFKSVVKHENYVSYMNSCISVKG